MNLPTPDPLFWPDMELFAVFLAVFVGGLIMWRLTVGRLPEQRPGDVGDLARHLGTVFIIGAIGLVLLCGACFYVQFGMAELRGIPVPTPPIP
jgi:hypothetical protein